jgi:hypothetical protein
MTYAKTSQRAERRALREKMRATGLGYREIATELARRYNFRPRTAWREAYGWSLREAAHHINTHTGDTGIDPTGIAGMTGAHLCEYEQWPGYNDEPTGRRPTPYLLTLLAAIYGCAVTELIDLADRQHLKPAHLLILDTHHTNHPHPHTAIEIAPGPAGSPPTPALRPAPDDARAIVRFPETAVPDITRFMATPGSLAPEDVAYRWFQEPVLNGSWIGREVEMAAHDGSEHAEQAEQRDIGDATLEQLRSDVIRLSHDYMTDEPFGLFQEMRRVRARMYSVLDRRLWPRDETDLYLLLGCLNCLMAGAASDLGYPHASDELIRAAWAYAVAIDHGPLKAKLRLDLASNAYWRNRPRQSRDLAESGLRYLAAGPTAAQLHLKFGRAAALMGDTDIARRAIGEAQDARELSNQDDLLQLGGEFVLSRASQDYLAGSIFLEIPDAESDAITDLERATERYAAGPEEGEDHGFGMQMLAHSNLAVARLRVGELDGARPALRPVLALPPAKRIDPLPQRLEVIRSELAGSRYHGSPQANDLADEVEDFGRDTIVGMLASLPS